MKAVSYYTIFAQLCCAYVHIIRYNSFILQNFVQSAACARAAVDSTPSTSQTLSAMSASFTSGSSATVPSRTQTSCLAVHMPVKVPPTAKNPPPKRKCYYCKHYNFRKDCNRLLCVVPCVIIFHAHVLLKSCLQ
jgi:hypothetical protein